MECPHCVSSNVIKFGIRTLVGGIKKQRYQCNTCGRTFYNNGEEYVMFEDERKKLLKARGKKSARALTPVRMGEPPHIVGQDGLNNWMLKNHKRMEYIFDVVLPNISDEKVEEHYQSMFDKKFNEIAEKEFLEQVKQDDEMKRRKEFVQGIFPQQLYRLIYRGSEKDWNDEIVGDVEGFEGEKVKLKDLFEDWDLSNMWSPEGLNATIDRIMQFYPDGTVLTPRKFLKPGKKRGTFIT